jgi:hypothetical protein
MLRVSYIRKQVPGDGDNRLHVMVLICCDVSIRCGGYHWQPNQEHAFHRKLFLNVTSREGLGTLQADNTDWMGGRAV